MDGHLEHWSRERGRFVGNRMRSVGKRVARLDIRELRRDDNVAGMCDGDAVRLLAVERLECPDALRAARRDVEHARVGLELARINAQIRLTARERIDGRLPGISRERIAHRALDKFF